MEFGTGWLDRGPASGFLDVLDFSLDVVVVWEADELHEIMELGLECPGFDDDGMIGFSQGRKIASGPWWMGFLVVLAFALLARERLNPMSWPPQRTPPPPLLCIGACPFGGGNASTHTHYITFYLYSYLELPIP
jgi:hypothetical protein